MRSWPFAVLEGGGGHELGRTGTCQVQLSFSRPCWASRSRYSSFYGGV